MPDYLQIANLGLVGALTLFVWKLPEITGILFAYLRERQGARDREFDKLGEIFRTALTEIMDKVQEDQRRDREQNQQQFKELITAVDKRVCGFVEQHRHQTLVTPLGTTDVAHMGQGSAKGPEM